jgi:solute carrier family 25 oxoglutarate transporter 11
MKHTLGFGTLFLTFDWLIDKLSVMWRISDVPRYLLAAMSAGFSCTLTAFFVYPFSNTVREMVEKWPKKDGICPYDGSYRKAMHYLWYSDFWNTAFPGLFKSFYWHHAPQWFITLMFSYKLGIFNYWRVDTFSGPGDNNNEDSFI